MVSGLRYTQRRHWLATLTKMPIGDEKSMKRLSYFAMAALLTAGLSMPAFSQAKKAAPADPCAQYKTAPKGEKAADKKTRTENLKKCQADQKAAKQKAAPAKKGGK